MPIYEYDCDACGERFELLVTRSRAKRHPACEGCGSERTRRVMSGFVGRRTGGDGAGHVGSACAGCTAGSCSGCTR